MKLAVGLVMLMFVLGSASLLYTAYKDNKNLDNSLIVNRRRVDSLFKVNDLNVQQVLQLKGKMDSATAKANELRKTVTQTNVKLSGKEKEIVKSRLAIDSAQKKIELLLASQKDNGKRWNELKAQNEQLEKARKDLSSRIIVLSASNDQLNEALLSVKDNILLRTFNQRGKLNVKAKRVKKIEATLSVPMDLKKPTFKLFDPMGNLLKEDYGSFNFHRVNEVNLPTAGGYQATKIELTYSPLKKMMHGTYKIEMLDGNRHMGNLMISLR